MKTNSLTLIAFSWGIFTTSSCIEPYNPPGLQANVNYLVIDGFLNCTDKTCNVKLSRTIALSSDSIPPAEGGALVELINEDGSSTKLIEGNKGEYSISNLEVNNKKYGLKIVTSDHTEYRSDMVPVVQAPPIDSVTWSNERLGVSIKVNTHDPNNSTHYYAWKFTETWAYHTPYLSEVIAENHLITVRPKRLYDCWLTENSTTINVASSTQLGQDIISDFSLTTIPWTSRKLQLKYSVLVEQRGISREAFEYQQELKKNTENLGSLFDPLPSTIDGNVHCITNPNDHVLGYFNAGYVSKKRIFIRNKDIGRPKGVHPITGYEDCRTDTLMNAWPRRGEFVVGIIYTERIIIIGFVTTRPFCADCRLLGGTTDKPDYWE
jgi:hypothetical protein